MIQSKGDQRSCNFSAGPAQLPLEVLEQVQDELLNFQGQGASVMELSHRGSSFMDVAERAREDLIDLLNIPDSYRVLFMQGGARGQFAAVPLNLGERGSGADYINSGYWAGAAIDEASRFLTVNRAACGESRLFRSLPEESDWHCRDDAAYLHYTPNETINGVEFPFIPQSGDVPLVADMSSCILSEPLDVSRFGVIYAGFQKNIGPSGLTAVIVREDLLGRSSKNTPSILDYSVQDKNNSMFSTPPTFAWYVAGLVFQWLKKQGGVEAMAESSRRKSEKLYRCIDNSSLYQNRVDLRWRSRMNIPFTLNDEELTARFLEQACKEGLIQLQGHQSAGGVRASLYNAVSEAQVDRLVAFMEHFASRMGAE